VQQPLQIPHLLHQLQRPQLPKLLRPLPILHMPALQNRHERHFRIPRRQRIINIVPNVERRRRIAPCQNLQQSFRMRLPLRVIHRNHGAEMLGRRPSSERKRKLLPRPPGKQIQLIQPCPARDLRRRNQQFLIPHQTRLPVCPPIEFFKSSPCLVVSSRPPERGEPLRRHRPIVIVPRLALPLLQLFQGHSFPAQRPHRLQRRPPIRSAHIHQHSIHIENQHLR